MGRFYSGDIEGKFLFGLEDSLGSLDFGARLNIVFNGITWEHDSGDGTLLFKSVIEAIQNLVNEVDIVYDEESLEKYGDDLDNLTSDSSYTKDKYLSEIKELSTYLKKITEEVTEETYKEFVFDPSKIAELRDKIVSFVSLLSLSTYASQDIEDELFKASSLNTVLDACRFMSEYNQGTDCDPEYFGACTFEPDL